jgi:hypothetical protein
MPNYQYTSSQRVIVNKITDLKATQRRLRNKWLDIDVKINALKHILNKEEKQDAK